MNRKRTTGRHPNRDILPDTAVSLPTSFPADAIPHGSYPVGKGEAPLPIPAKTGTSNPDRPMAYQDPEAVTDVEITPEMIEAGAKLIADACDMHIWAAEGLVREVFAVMRKGSKCEQKAPQQ